MDEAGRAGRGVRAEKNAQLLQIDRFGDVEEVQHPEIAARDYPCGTDVPEMWLCRWCDSHKRLDAWTRRRRTQGFLVFWLLKKNEARERTKPTTRVLRLGKLGRSNAAPLRGPLRGGEEFDFDPAGFAAVEKFVGIDGGREGLEIGQHRRGIDDIGANQIDELGNVFAMIAIANA